MNIRDILRQVMTLEEIISFNKPTSKTPIEQMLQRRLELQSIVEDGEALLSTLNAELLERLKSQGVDELLINDHKLQRIERVSFSDVPLEFAKKFRAVKKVVDGSVLRPLYKNGVKIPNVKVSEYISVK